MFFVSMLWYILTYLNDSFYVGNGVTSLVIPFKFEKKSLPFEGVRKEGEGGHYSMDPVLLNCTYFSLTKFIKT